MSPRNTNNFVRAIAFHLPQFHPIPENDEWWGKGFTEWTNVTKARPYFRGHTQPHLSSDLGFYDLRLPEAREAQALLAQEYGIHGFCYYHYWFNGREILERPVNEIVSSGEPDFPFCLCWANENWTRRWDGLDSQVLLKQEYHADDDIAHIRRLIPIFKDPRYIKVEGKPLFLIYRLGLLADPVMTISIWRREMELAGFPGIYLANVESIAEEHGLASKLPVDASVEFAPDWNCLVPSPPPFGKFSRLLGLNKAWKEHRICSYPALVEKMLSKEMPDYTRFPCVTPMWDNSARRGSGATILKDSSPEAYLNWLTEVLDRFSPPTGAENFVFINAWNEWAEGNHLEPCQRWGRAYLEATKQALDS